MQRVIEIEHNESVEVSADLKHFAQNLPRAVLLHPAVCPVKVAVSNTAIRLVLQRIDQRADVMPVVQIVVTEIADILTLGAGQSLIERKRYPTILVPVDKDDSRIVELADNIINSLPAVSDHEYFQVTVILTHDTGYCRMQIPPPVVGWYKHADQRP